MTGSTGVAGSTGVEPTGGPVTTSGSTGAECMFLMCGDMTVTEPECDIWNEDCPEGSKCMPWDNTGGSSTRPSARRSTRRRAWRAIGASAAGPTESRQLRQAPAVLVHGQRHGHRSLHQHVHRLRGVAELSERAELRHLEQRLADPVFDGVRPAGAELSDGQICFQGAFDFICDFDASGEEGQYGDACAYINVCDYGLFCATPAAVPGCVSAEGCCSEVLRPQRAGQRLLRRADAGVRAVVRWHASAREREHRCLRDPGLIAVDRGSAGSVGPRSLIVRHDGRRRWARGPFASFTLVWLKWPWTFGSLSSCCRAPWMSSARQPILKLPGPAGCQW